jgi:hypothetical protein
MRPIHGCFLRSRVPRRRGTIGRFVGQPVAQPEHPGACIGPMLPGTGNGRGLAATQHDAFDLLFVADGALVKNLIKLGGGRGTTLAHGGGEFGDPGNPVVDRARRHAQHTGKRVGGGAPPAVIARQRALFGAVECRTSDGSHGGLHNTGSIPRSMYERQYLYARRLRTDGGTTYLPPNSSTVMVQAWPMPTALNSLRRTFSRCRDDAMSWA